MANVGWISPYWVAVYHPNILPDLKRLGLTYERDKRAKYDGKSTRGVVQGLRAVEEPPSAEWEGLQHQEQMHRKLMGYTPSGVPNANIN